MEFDVTAAIFQLYRGDLFYWQRKPERTANLGQVIGKLYHIQVERTFF